MKQSQYFLKTSKTISQDDVSVNARFLEQGGFIYKNSAGVYTYLPLGWRVLQKVAAIIREEMNAIGGQEMYMPALHDKHYLQATGRWDVDVVYKVIEGNNKEPNFNISWTHEEIMSEVAAHFVNSYKDLPFATYQIQTKFRHEPRAKSGLLRGREFMMKDMYSFHKDDADIDAFYEVVAQAYTRIFKRVGLKAYYTLAAGGDFTTNFTHEFQVECAVGEDLIYVCGKCEYSENKEVSKLKDGDTCDKCGGVVHEKKAVEVGNIFRYGTKYSEPFNLQFTDADGQKKYVVSGAYGIGLGRLMGTVVEVMHDDNGIIWPEAIAPFKVHLIALNSKDNTDATGEADTIYQNLQAAGIDVLYDDRSDKTAGEKFADSDLIGIPYRVVVSAKTLAEQSAEIKKRASGETELLPLATVINYFTNP